MILLDKLLWAMKDSCDIRLILMKTVAACDDIRNLKATISICLMGQQRGSVNIDMGIGQ